MTDYIIIAMLAAALILLAVLLLRPKKSGEAELREELRRSFSESSAGIREEFARSRKETADGSDRTAATLRSLQSELIKAQNDTGEKLLKEQADGRHRIDSALREQSEKLTATLSDSVSKLQQSNEKKLDQMRETVDEKLNDTLTKRLDSSFKTVSEQLQMVYKSLGEMKELSSGVNELQRVLSNVKTRGTWAEVQLGNILEQTLTRDQYDTNVSVKNNRELVEYAVKIPSADSDSDYAWLPIDSKFPIEDYARLQEASERGDSNGVEEASKSLENRIRTEAREINKYIDPPATTGFAIMFLPTEGLYAEVLRRPGFAEELQNNYRVMIAGPTTITAFLNTLSMGFRTIAINKKANEVWKVLGAMRSQYEKFNDALIKAKKSIDQAGKNIDDVTHRNNQIGKKLRNVDRIDDTEAQAILPVSGEDSDSDAEDLSADGDS